MGVSVGEAVGRRVRRDDVSGRSSRKDVNGRSYDGSLHRQKANRYYIISGSSLSDNSRSIQIE